MNIRQNSRGDTIVEVLLALTVLTAVLVGAYVTANRSQQASQAAKERGEAVKLAESQLERLKGILTKSPATIFPPNSFCIKDDNTFEPIGSPADPFIEPLETSTLPYEQSAGVPGACGNRSDLYNVALKKDASGTYNILIRWNRIGGNKDQINMYYRAYK